MPIYGDQFKTYKGNATVYIECGMYLGDSMQKGIDAGYEELYGIDIDPVSVNHCKERFKDNPNVHCILGDSAYVLADVLKRIEGKSATLFSDAHFGIHNGTYTPLLNELNEVLASGQKNHHIAIDDLRLLKNAENQIPWTLQEVLNKLKEINPKYRFVFERGFQDNDVLFAILD